MTSKMVTRAVQAYAQGQVDLRGGAALAGVSYNRFLHEVQARRIVILEDDNFLERLQSLANAFGSQELGEAIRCVEVQSYD